MCIIIVIIEKTCHIIQWTLTEMNEIKKWLKLSENNYIPLTKCNRELHSVPETSWRLQLLLLTDYLHFKRANIDQQEIQVLLE